MKHKTTALNKYNISKKLFLKWRSPRFGDKNPTCLDNPVWEWLIRSKVSAYKATEEMKCRYPFDNGATWCFSRFGQSKTVLPDGRIIYIGGEHEDYYDPDFYIYNDVIVHNTNDSFTIYGYPKNIFQQTDFHTATLVGNKIYIIGNLGYTKERKIGATHIYSLNIKNYEFKKIESSGENPGWIHKHEAEYIKEKNKIIIRSGKIYLGNEKPLIENIDEWSLNLNNFKWKRISKRKWPRFIIQRVDRKHNNLWRLRTALVSKKLNLTGYKKEIKDLTKEIGKKPDLSLIDILYTPKIPHKEIKKKEEEFNIFRIKVNGIVVKFVEDTYHISLTVEGILPNDIIIKIKNDLLDKLTELEKTEYVANEITKI